MVYGFSFFLFVRRKMKEVFVCFSEAEFWRVFNLFYRFVDERIRVREVVVLGDFGFEFKFVGWGSRSFIFYFSCFFNIRFLRGMSIFVRRLVSFRYVWKGI